MWKIGLAAVMISLAIAPAQARYHHVISAAACGGSNFYPVYHFPGPDWGPFFARHVYVSHVITCLPTATAAMSEQPISVKY